MQDERIEQRVRAAYRARACAAGIACGAQIFAVGTGLLLPLALNAAYWAAVPALLLGGVIGLAAPKRLSKAPGSAFCAVLALSLLVCGALLLGAGATLAQQTLLPNGHLLTCLMLTLGFCLLAARPGGTGVCRVAFALRLLLPVALVVFAGFSLSSASAAGLFPLLGAGVRPLLLAALLGLSAGSPALMLFLPPQALETPAPVPKAGFFALRVVLGGLFGVLTLTALSLCNPYELLRDQHVWGARMTILSSTRPREGLVQALLTLSGKGENITDQHVRYVIGLVRSGQSERISELTQDVICITSKGRPVKPKTIGQKEYVNAILKQTVTIGVGPAGTGKTYLAVAAAVAAFRDKQVNRIILTRPAVEAGERLGFLPGDLQSKVDPYLRPLYDALFDMLGAETYQKYLERGNIEVAPLAYMRGRTLDDSFIILDEAQNTSREQMKMFLTRMGFGSKVVITGDVTQIDLPSDKVSGLKEAMKVLRDVEGVAICKLTKEDVVRHVMVQRIIEAYAKFEEKKK